MDNEYNFGNLKRIKPREVWSKEASNFTPWLFEHIDNLASVLGLELEVVQKEADVGDFSVDILAKDLNSNSNVIIENQLEKTDHDHLGKLLTYAADYEARYIIWIAKEFRDEHRAAIEWLNNRTDANAFFFAVKIDILQIDDSRIAPDFVAVVTPNELLKESLTKRTYSTKGEKYRIFFQGLIDDLREKHSFTNARVAQPQNWYSFASGITGISFGFSFTGDSRVKVELYIDLYDEEFNLKFISELEESKNDIEQEIGYNLIWEKLDGKRATRVAYYKNGNIEISSEELEEVKNWAIENLIKFKRVFDQRIKKLREVISKSIN